MADPAAHDGIGDLWNQKAIHHLVVFTCLDGDFELIGVGPTLPYTTLAEAEHHVVEGKTPEFYVKCPGAIAGRLQPKLAPTQLGSPGLPRASTTAPIAILQPATTPTMKARTAAPFMRPQIKLNPKSAEPGAGSGEQKPETQHSKRETPPTQPATSNPQPASSPDLAAREHAIAQREQELSALAASLKIREASLRDRESAIAAIEERLLHPPRKSG